MFCSLSNICRPISTQKSSYRYDSLTSCFYRNIYNTSSTFKDKASNWFTKLQPTLLYRNCWQSNGLAHKGLTPNTHCSDSVGHVASFSSLKCPHHAPELLTAKVPTSLYSLIINFIFHRKTVNKMGRWGAGERLVRWRRLRDRESKTRRRKDEAWGKRKRKKVNENAWGQKGGPNIGDKEGEGETFLQGLYFPFNQALCVAEASQCLFPS